jgi:hypothetical protein
MVVFFTPLAVPTLPVLPVVGILIGVAPALVAPSPAPSSVVPARTTRQKVAA